MPCCPNCKLNFSRTVFIDNKKRYLSKRIYCLNCSPFGKRNTKKIHVQNKNQYCPKCKKNNLCDLDFYTNPKTGKTHSYCRACISQQSLNRQRNIKSVCVTYKGGKCSLCGYDKYQGALDFHHLDPKEKDFNVSKLKSYKWSEKIKTELDKCILVCSNCHREIHAGLINL